MRLLARFMCGQNINECRYVIRYGPWLTTWLPAPRMLLNEPSGGEAWTGGEEQRDGKNHRPKKQAATPKANESSNLAKLVSDVRVDFRDVGRTSGFVVRVSFS